jgi:hypothetical protein
MFMAVPNPSTGDLLMGHGEGTQTPCARAHRRSDSYAGVTRIRFKGWSDNNTDLSHEWPPFGRAQSLPEGPRRQRLSLAGGSDGRRLGDFGLGFHGSFHGNAKAPVEFRNFRP